MNPPILRRATTADAALLARIGRETKRIYLAGPAQGAGVGGRLFDEVMDWMAAQAPPDIWIGVWSQNLGAQRFYARRGFEKVGEYGFPVGKTLDREFILRRRPAF